ncbi:MAG: nuclear transport factor 2 family protein [Opitutales bacterium]
MRFFSLLLCGRGKCWSRIRGMLGPGLLILSLGLPGTLAAAVPKAEATRIIQTFLKSWETGDAETFASLLHEDVLFAYPGGRFGKAELVETFTDYQTAKKDIKIYFWDRVISDGETHVTAYQFAATDVATDKRFAVGTGVICKIAEGRIVLFKEYFDTTVAAAQRAGELPLDEGEVTPWPASIWLRPDTID